MTHLYLILYYTLTGKTELVAKTIARELDAKIEQIKTEKPINISDFTRFSLSNLFLIHSIISHKKLKINKPVYNAQDFDRIIILTPVWMNNPAPAINSYVESQNFKNKEVGIVATVAGNGNAQNTFSVMNSAINKKKGRVIITKEFNIEKSEEEIIEEVREFVKNLNNYESIPI